MRNSEESSKPPTRPLFVREVRGPVLPARAWCDLLDTPAFGIRNIGGPGAVQYAAYCALVFFLSFGVGRDESGIIRFRSFWWGWRFTLFSSQVSILLPPSTLLVAALCGR
ncbi:uncharacterized protein N7458_008222, partial [Penicillium daleae]